MSEPRDFGRAHADYDIHSPFRSYLRVCRDLIVEPEAFFGTVRGGSLWRPTLLVFVTYLLVSLLLAPTERPPRVRSSPSRYRWF
jgi:hypothetical protein